MLRRMLLIYGFLILDGWTILAIFLALVSSFMGLIWLTTLPGITKLDPRTTCSIVLSSTASKGHLDIHSRWPTLTAVGSRLSHTYVSIAFVLLDRLCALSWSLVFMFVMHTVPWVSLCGHMLVYYGVVAFVRLHAGLKKKSHASTCFCGVFVLQ